MSFAVNTPEFFTPAAGRFVPSDLAEVFCWLRADTPDKITVATGVSSWQSEVGNFDFVQATGTQQPLLRSASPGSGQSANFMPFVDFDGVDDRLVYSGTFTTATVGEIFAVVHKTDPTNDFGAIFGLGLSTLATPWLWHVVRADSAGGQLQHTTDSVAAQSSTSQMVNAGHVSLVNLRSDGTTVSMFQNRIAWGTPGTHLWYGDIASHDRATVGGLTRTTFNSPFKGKIYEIIWTDSVLSAEKRALLLRYLRAKYQPLMTFAAIGDSLTAAGGTSDWPAAARTRWADTRVEGLRLRVHAAANETTSDALTRWTNDVKGNGYDGIVLLSSVNDFDAGTPDGAASFVNLKTILDEALAESLQVILSTVIGFGDATSWFQSRQNELDIFNGLIRVYVAANSHRHIQLVDAYRAFSSGNDPAKPARDLMAPDGVHLSATGDALMADLVQTAVQRLPNL